MFHVLARQLQVWNNKWPTQCCSGSKEQNSRTSVMFSNKYCSGSDVMSSSRGENSHDKFEDCYLFYINIEAIEQMNRGFYDIRVSCKFDDGDINLDLFSLHDGYSSGEMVSGFVGQNHKWQLWDPTLLVLKNGVKS